MNELQAIEAWSAAMPAARLATPPHDFATAVTAVTAPAGASFADLVSRSVQNVNQQLLGSQQDLQVLALGESQNLHQIMMRLEESRLSFQLMMQVRNRLLESYQDVMKMQI